MNLKKLRIEFKATLEAIRNHISDTSSPTAVEPLLRQLLEHERTLREKVKVPEEEFEETKRQVRSLEEQLDELLKELDRQTKAQAVSQKEEVKLRTLIKQQRALGHVLLDNEIEKLCRLVVAVRMVSGIDLVNADIEEDNDTLKELWSDYEEAMVEAAAMLNASIRFSAARLPMPHRPS